MLEVERITFSYGRRRVVDDVSFDIAPGEIVALTGPNGAGKTTLVKVLACLLMQEAGLVRLDEVDPLMRPVKYRRLIGYLSERCPLYDEMTVDEYITYRVRLKGERNLRVRRRVSESLEMCGLGDVAAMRIRLLSQGYRKRVGLAEAVALHPRLLLLDDLLAGIDAGQRKKTAALLSAASSRSAILVTGHELHELLPWCTRFLVMSQGRLVASLRSGEHDRAELLRLLETHMAGNIAEGAEV
ncbi:MAG: ABC transporter ATP-binding protein [Kiritimatiellae bacterium]|nr:ABC transporter ATP-binding protein [Kiritimatiellia bacterium]MDD4024462.1 ABC transporter ATP-binding protein [Kiritimatiellia bacterium]MDD4622287.1 ABC transporter ATP-binding protein [Kiritimatiellia bacterium]